MEVPASNRTEREKRPDSGSDRSDFPTFLIFATRRLAGAKLFPRKSNLLIVERLPLCVGAAFVLVRDRPWAATEVESNA